MHALDLDGHVVHKPVLSTLAESPSQISSEATSSGSDTGSVTQGLNVAPRANSLKRSPLGRSVVTALKAELDQVCLDVNCAQPAYSINQYIMHVLARSHHICALCINSKHGCRMQMLSFGVLISQPV